MEAPVQWRSREHVRSVTVCLCKFSLTVYLIPEAIMEEDLSVAVSAVQKSNLMYLPDLEKTDKVDSWNPMDDDFSCPTFNSYKNFDILKAEHPNEKSPEKRVQQSPEKRAEEISLYIGNIPSTITNEGIKNLFSAVGKVHSCKVLPPKYACNDTKYGFVKFYTWKDAVRAIEEYDGLYVGSEKKLRVRVAHRRRGDDYFARDDEYSSPDGTAKDNLIQSHSDECQEVVENDVCERSLRLFKEQANFKNSDQNSNIPQQLQNVVKSESTMNEELFRDANRAAATLRTMMPCTCCEKLCKQRCSACKAPYCSRECQKNDRSRHKLVCTYHKNYKPAKSQAAPAHVLLTTNGPLPEHDDLDNDSDFDCIDISLEASTSGKAQLNTEQPNDGNVSLDGGYSCVDLCVATSNKSYCEELNSDPGMEKDTVDMNVIMASSVPYDILPSTKTFDIVVCYFMTPNSFWIWFLNTAKELFTRLTSLLNETYEQSTYSEYVPVTGQLIAAKCNDDIWYRAKVDCVNKDDTLEVTFIDFGNTENLSIYSTRKITETLAVIPKLATKCSLHTMKQPTGNWPADTLHFSSELMLNKRGTAILHKTVQDSLLLEINMEINGTIRSVVDEIVNQGHFISDEITMPSCDRHDLATSENPQQSPSKKEPVTRHYHSGHRPVLRSNEPDFPDKETILPFIQPISPSCNPVSYNKSQSLPSYCPTITGDKLVIFNNPPGNPSNIPPFKQVISHGSPPSPAAQHSTSPPDMPVKNPAVPFSKPATRDSMRVQPHDYRTTKPTSPISLGNQKLGLQSALPSPQNVAPEQVVCKTLLPIPTLPSTPFDVIVNEVSTAGRFYAQIIDPYLVRKLHKCVRELNQYIAKNRPPEVKNIIVGALGCAKFSQDNIWYRAQVVAIKELTYRVRFIDFGNGEDVNPLEFLAGPKFVFNLAPQAICCRLDTSVRFWTDQSNDMMKALTLNKQFSCVVVGDVARPEISVRLLSYVGDHVVDIAKELDKCNISIMHKN